MEGNEFTLGYLETTKVVRNYGSHWGIMNFNDDGDEQPNDQPKQQPQPMPRGRKNVRRRGEREQPVHQNAPMGGLNFRGDMTSYFDQLSLSVNWIGGMVENLVQQLHVE
ncbi:unnamed protein product [Lactuca saligna]|uniref:Uncharacterized protein n=1 Tax=Lactuca saligna TaxID=75948 RepID=A0AA35ZVH1_LACSI|nr:unnamed protein product [Lactuca saligna]